MKIFYVTLPLVAATVACKKPTANSEDLAAKVAKTYSFKLKAGQESSFKKEAKNFSDLSQNELCPFAQGKEYALAGEPEETLGHLKVTITASGFVCSFKTGFLHPDHVDIIEKGGSGSASGTINSPYCAASWEEKPGTTDYTIVDAYRGVNTSNRDREQSQTLQGDTKYKNLASMCARAKVVKHCFEKAVLKSTESSAVRYREWARAKGVDPVVALIAKTQRETKIGLLPDSCYRGNCNGIGIAQVISAFDENGRALSDYDSRWAGITHNILTNLKYSVRVLAEKTSRSRDLYDLAFYYNGSPQWQSAYASEVVKNYKELKSCGL